MKVLVQDLGPAQARATQAKVATGNTSHCDFPLPTPLCTLIINQRNHLLYLNTSMPYYVCVSLCIYLLFVLYLKSVYHNNHQYIEVSQRACWEVDK